MTRDQRIRRALRVCLEILEDINKRRGTDEIQEYVDTIKMMLVDVRQLPLPLEKRP